MSDGEDMETETSGQEEAGAEGDVEPEEKDSEALLEKDQAQDICLESITFFSY